MQKPKRYFGWMIAGGCLWVWLTILLNYVTPVAEGEAANRGRIDSKFTLHLWEYTIEKGDTFSGILEKMGLTKKESLKIQKKSRWCFPKNLYAGQEIVAEFYMNKRAVQVRSLALEAEDGDSYHLLHRDPGENNFTYALEPKAFRYDTAVVFLSVKYSVPSDVLEATQSQEVASQVMAIWSGDENFIRADHRGDSLQLMVERAYDRYDRPTGYGDVLAARLIQGHLDHWAIQYSWDDAMGYFTPEGKSVKQFLLKAPLNYTRISSPFAPSRLHPVLKKRKPHVGVDYAAPYGTKVFAAGDGVVEYTKWVRGYGRAIKIKHNESYNTYYGHLRSYAFGVEPGTWVKQGQVIGYVGNSGLSTGPHLCYRVQRNGRYINPRHLRKEKGKIPRYNWEQFEEVVQKTQALFGYQDMSYAQASGKGSDIH